MLWGGNSTEKCGSALPLDVQGEGPGQWRLEMICCKGGRWELKRAPFSEFSHLQGIHVDWRVAEQWDGLESECGPCNAAVVFVENLGPVSSAG